VPDGPDAQLREWLLNRDQAMRYLVRRRHAFDPPGHKLVLTSPGRTLAMKIEDACRERSPVPRTRTADSSSAERVRAEEARPGGAFLRFRERFGGRSRIA